MDGKRVGRKKKEEEVDEKGEGKETSSSRTHTKNICWKKKEKKNNASVSKAMQHSSCDRNV